ncbi:hypothetical protein AB0469_31865 [Streptomyces sp. NPDC093801]|uniref:hypothetical protein n=1 Tax=Streptomyces sp. NPDC093801 TaxID=3155203 RepID=UPI00344BE546
MIETVSLPVVLRIGDIEAEIATLDLPASGGGWATNARRAIADMLRAAADAYEHPDPAGEEVPHAAP